MVLNITQAQEQVRAALGDPQKAAFDIIKTVRDSPDILASLSPEASISISSLGGAIDNVLELKNLRARDGFNAAASAATFAAVKAFGAASSVIPILGALVSFASMVWDDQERLAQEKAAKAAAAEQEQLQRLQVLLRPIPSGPQNKVLPADVFAYQVYDVSYFGKPSDEAQRSVLGDLLVRVTESGLLSTKQWMKEEGVTYGVRSTSVWDPADHKLIVDSLRADLKDPRLGIPKDKAVLLRNLRRAMQAAWRPKPGVITDGGASIFPVYLDVITSLFTSGHLTPEFVRKYVQRWVVRPSGEPPKVIEGGTQEASDFGVAAPFLLRFLDQWRAEVLPFYKQDQAGRQELKAKAEQLTKIAALTEVGAMIPAGLLKGLTQTEIDAALGGRKLRLRPNFKGVAPSSSASPLIGVAVYGGAGLAIGLLIRSMRAGKSAGGDRA